LNRVKEKGKNMMKLGLVGWRGMVGSVLMQRMVEEGDFEHVEPLYFSTSAVGGKAPLLAGKEAGPLQDAMSIEALSRMDIVITCQGGDYTKEVFPRLRAAGWQRTLDRRRVDPAHARRRGDHPRSGEPRGHQGTRWPGAVATGSAATARFR
jgi:aspartate-semialdehyde dehydrogenase